MKGHLQGIGRSVDGPFATLARPKPSGGGMPVVCFHQTNSLELCANPRQYLESVLAIAWKYGLDFKQDQPSEHDPLFPLCLCAPLPAANTPRRLTGCQCATTCYNAEALWNCVTCAISWRWPKI